MLHISLILYTNLILIFVKCKPKKRPVSGEVSIQFFALVPTQKHPIGFNDVFYDDINGMEHLMA